MLAEHAHDGISSPFFEGFIDMVVGRTMVGGFEKFWRKKFEIQGFTVYDCFFSVWMQGKY
jgi:hypothetical protein